MFGAVDLVQRGVLGFDGNDAGSVNGVAGVDREIGQDLVKLRRVQLDRPNGGARPPVDGNVFADEAA